jgi:Acetyltransferase (GNAT) domain
LDENTTAETRNRRSFPWRDESDAGWPPRGGRIASQRAAERALLRNRIMNLPLSRDVPSAVILPFREMRRGDAWQRWSELAASAPPFLAPEFFGLAAPLCESGEPMVAGARQSHGLIGALPFLLADHTLLALNSDQSPGYDYLGAPEGVDAIWRELRGDRRWHVMVLANVPEDSLLATRLCRLASDDACPVMVRPGARHPFFELRDFEAQMNPKFLTNLRRCARKAGGVELERLMRPTQKDFAEALALEALAWKGAAGTSIGTDPKVAHLYHAATRLFGRRGRAALCFLRAGGKRIALLLSVEDGHTLYALKIGYDPACYSLSPGHLMVWQVALDAARRGLFQLDFVGREDDWKRKWTARAHQQVTVMIYQRSPRGLLLYALREKVKPLLPADPRAPLRRGCQRNDILGAHSAVERLRGRLDAGLGLRSGVRRALRPARKGDERLGPESRFRAGSWVRVKSESEVRATLDGKDRLRGLGFVPSQWAECGEVRRVEKSVRRIRDDRGRLRPVARTVLLDGVTCAGHGTEPAGCGRHCPLMFRDEWLEPSEAPRREPPGPSLARHARVRDLDEIRLGLDLHGRRDGLGFSPEMGAYSGKRFRIVSRLPKVFEYDHWVEPRAPIYILEGLACSGAVLGDKGPCDRACALLWHQDWLELEPEGNS